MCYTVDSHTDSMQYCGSDGDGVAQCAVSLALSVRLCLMKPRDDTGLPRVAGKLGHVIAGYKIQCGPLPPVLLPS